MELDSLILPRGYRRKMDGIGDKQIGSCLAAPMKNIASSHTHTVEQLSPNVGLEWLAILPGSMREQIPVLN